VSNSVILLMAIFVSSKTLDFHKNLQM